MPANRRPSVRPFSLVVAMALGIGVALAGPAASTGAAPAIDLLSSVGATTAEGSYYETVPTRLLDTRRTSSRQPLAAGSTTTIQVGGNAGVPTSGVSAVVLNLTAVDTTGNGYFTAYPSGQVRPTASTVNFPKGWTGAAMTTVRVGGDGAIGLYTYGGPAHAVVDVVGWYAADDSVREAEGMGTMFYPDEHADRIFDSRREGGALSGGDHVELVMDHGSPTTNASVRSWVVNLTAVGATRPGVVSAWSGQGTRPTASTLNYEPGVVAPNMAVVTAGHPSGGGTSLRLDVVSSGSVHLVVDVVGVMRSDQQSGLRFRPFDVPTRIADSRRGLGLSGPIPAKGTRTLDMTSVSSRSLGPVVTTMTGVLPAARTYLSVWAHCCSERPTASVLNVEKGQVRSSPAYLPTGNDDMVDIYSDSRTDLVVDAVGVFSAYVDEGAVPRQDRAPDELGELLSPGLADVRVVRR